MFRRKQGAEVGDIVVRELYRGQYLLGRVTERRRFMFYVSGWVVIQIKVDPNMLPVDYRPHNLLHIEHCDRPGSWIVDSSLKQERYSLWKRCEL